MPASANKNLVNANNPMMTITSATVFCVVFIKNTGTMAAIMMVMLKTMKGIRRNKVEVVVAIKISLCNSLFKFRYGCQIGGALRFCN
jgi:hypothetical protein